jgi:hypothetical protein
MKKDVKKSSSGRVVSYIVYGTVIIVGVVIYVRAVWFDYVLPQGDLTALVGALIAVAGANWLMEAV